MGVSMDPVSKKLSHVLRGLHIAFLLHGLDSILSYSVCKEVYLFVLELQLFRVQADIVFTSCLEQFAEGLVVL